jgi:hypothetical protein
MITPNQSMNPTLPCRMTAFMFARHPALAYLFLVRCGVSHADFSGMALYQRLRRVPPCSGEVATRAFWRTTRFAPPVVRPSLAKPASTQVRIRRSVSPSPTPSRFFSRVFSKHCTSFRFNVMSACRAAPVASLVKWPLAIRMPEISISQWYCVIR